jgi:hypothetical protein
VLLNIKETHFSSDFANSEHCYNICEIRELKQSGITRAKTAGAKFIKRTAGYSSIDSRRSENILKDLYIDSPGKKMAQ